MPQPQPDPDSLGLAAWGTRADLMARGGSGVGEGPASLEDRAAEAENTAGTRPERKAGVGLSEPT